MTAMLHGTDISAFQSTAVPAGDFVIIKATQGTGYVNSKLAAQLADARKKGMLVGFYHFPEFGNDPLADGKHFCDVVAPLLKPGDKVILDHETYPSPSAAHAAAWGLKFLPYTEKRCARRPWVYANVDWASHGYCAGMGAYPYWCADPSSPAGKPRVRGPFKTWIAHQYDISGVDRDVFNGTRADWLGSPPTPTEVDMPFAGQIPAGKGQQVNVSFPKGSLKSLGLVIDNSFTLPGVIEAQPQAEVRLAIHRADGTHQVVNAKAGRGAADAKTVKAVVKFDKPADTDYVSMVRLDDGKTPVGWDMS